ncbi:MAG: hypothetical protein ACM3JF_02320, partial [Sphaerimonospora mesophila]
SYVNYYTEAKVKLPLVVSTWTEPSDNFITDRIAARSLSSGVAVLSGILKVMPVLVNFFQFRLPAESQ